MTNEKRLSLLPSLIISKKGAKLLQISYDLLKGWYPIPLNILPYWLIDVHSISESKFLVLGYEEQEFKSFKFCYDLKTSKVLEFKPALANIKPEGIKGKFFNIIKDGKDTVVKKITINENDLTVKSSKKILIRTREHITQIKQFSQKWLLVCYGYKIYQSKLVLYYRSTPQDQYKEKKVDHSRSDIKGIICRVSDKELIIIIIWYYWLIVLGDDGNITSKCIGQAEFNDYFNDIKWHTTLSHGTMALIGKVDSQKTESSLVIKTFNRESVLHTQIIPFFNRNIIPLNDNYFAVEPGKSIEIWYRDRDLDYRQVYKISLEDCYKNCNIHPILPPLELKIQIIKYLEPLILIPKDLIVNTIEFF